MLSKLSLLSLFLVASVFAQSRPTGGFVDPDEKDAIEKEQIILAQVKENMGMCNDKETPLNSMKDLYGYLASIQNKKAVEAVQGTDDVANGKNAQCDKPKFKLVSSEVTCLLNGVEETMYAFSKNQASSQYLEKSLGISKEEARGMLQFMEYMNEPGYTAVKERKNNKAPKKVNENDGKI